MRVVHTAAVLPVAVLWADAGVVQARRHGMARRRLTIGALKHLAERAVQDAALAVAERGAMFAALDAASARFDADQLDIGIEDERVEHAGGVAAAAHAGYDHVGQPADLFHALL